MNARDPLGSPDPRAVAVVVRGNKLLVIACRLDGEEYAVLPGGNIVPHETAEKTAARALAEATSLTATRVVDHLFDTYSGGQVASYFRAEVPEGELVLGGPRAEDEPADHQFRPLWATPGELSLLDLRPEGLVDLVLEAVWPLTVDEAGPEDWPVVERLWQLYQHDLSEFRHSAPDEEGLFTAARLAAYGQDNRDAVAYLARLGDVPCGFALLRGLRRDQRMMGEFFVTRSERGRGVAADFARDVFARHPGRWLVPFQNENPRAAAFWRRLAAEALVKVSEKTVPVPGKPHLPHDVFLTGRTRRA